MLRRAYEEEEETQKTRILLDVPPWKDPLTVTSLQKMELPRENQSELNSRPVGFESCPAGVGCWIWSLPRGGHWNRGNRLDHPGWCVMIFNSCYIHYSLSGSSYVLTHLILPKSIQLILWPHLCRNERLGIIMQTFINSPWIYLPASCPWSAGLKYFVYQVTSQSAIPLLKY